MADFAREFLSWYGRQLAFLRRNAADPRPADALVIEPLGEARLRLTRRRKHSETVQTATIPLSALAQTLQSETTLVLRLPEALLLSRKVVLPLAAEHDVAAVLRLNFDTLTPFPPDAAYWNWQIERRDAANARLHLRLSLLPKAIVTELLGALPPTDGRAHVAEFGSGARLRVVPLSQTGPHHNRTRHAMVYGLAAGALLALLLAPIGRDWWRLRAIEAEITALRPLFTKAEAVRRELNNGAAGLELLASERQTSGDVLHSLAVLTEALPVDSFLTELSLNQRHLNIAGESADTARLILALTNAASLRAVSFSAPVTHAPSGGRDKFAISAQVQP